MLKTYMTLYANDIYCALKMFIFLQIQGNDCSFRRIDNIMGNNKKHFCTKTTLFNRLNSFSKKKT